MNPYLVTQLRNAHDNGALCREAAGRDFHVSTNPTVRNVRIVTGLAMLAALEMEEV